MEEPSLNIIIYGKNILADIHKIVDGTNSPTLNSGYPDTHYFIEEYSGWKYFLIQNVYNSKVNRTIKNILADHYKQKFLISFFNDKNSEMKVEKNILLDVLIICVDKLEDKDSKIIFKDIQNYTRCTSKLPFIIFLTLKEDNPDIEIFYDLIENKFFDIRNLFAYKFPKTLEEKSQLKKKLNYIFNYYNSIASTDQSKINSLNIMIAGQAGAGKSTLQNLLQGEKIAREGEGGAITFKISFYTDKRYNLTKIDSPGFENEKTVNYVLGEIRKFRSQMTATKDHIDCIIYLIKSSSDRIFYDMEKNLIKEIIGYEDVEIIFCSNTFGLEEESDEYYKNKEIIEDELMSIMNEINNISNERKEKILDSIVYVNLVNKLKNVNEISIPCYGIDKLLGKIYELMVCKKIDETKIIKAKNLDEIIEVTKNYQLLKMFQNSGDFKLRNRINLSKYILGCAKGDFWKDFFIIGFFGLKSRRKDMIKKISEDYGEKISDKDLDKIYNEIDEEIKNNKWKAIVSKFFLSMEQYKTYFLANGFDFNPKCYNEYTIAIGSYLLNKYEGNSFLFDNNASKVILELSRGINNGIEGLNSLSQEWVQIQKDIKVGKSNIEWVRRFFKLKKA